MAMDKKLKKDMMHASSGNDVPDKDASPDPIFCEKEEEVIPNLDGQSFDPMPPMPSFAQGPGSDKSQGRSGRGQCIHGRTVFYAARCSEPDLQGQSECRRPKSAAFKTGSKPEPEHR